MGQAHTPFPCGSSQAKAAGPLRRRAGGFAPSSPPYSGFVSSPLTRPPPSVPGVACAGCWCLLPPEPSGMFLPPHGRPKGRDGGLSAGAAQSLPGVAPGWEGTSSRPQAPKDRLSGPGPARETRAGRGQRPSWGLCAAAGSSAGRAGHRPVSTTNSAARHMSHAWGHCQVLSKEDQPPPTSINGHRELREELQFSR